MNPRPFIRHFFKEFRPGLAFGWTLICGILMGWSVQRGGESASHMIFLFIVLSSPPWVPLVLGAFSESVSKNLYMGSGVYHEDYSRALKLVGERRIWEAAEEMEKLRAEKPEDMEVLYRLAEVHWINLGNRSVALDRYGEIWKKIRRPDQHLLWDKRVAVERAMSVASRIADIRYMSRDFSGARQILEELMNVRGSDLRDTKDAVLERMDGLKPLRNARAQTLVLFDVDGTLSISGGAGGKAVAEAFEDVYGKSIDLSKIDFRGRTDISLWREMLSTHGLSYAPDDPHLAAFQKKYLEHLRRRLVKSDPRSTPGARVILDRLEREPTVALALLTGNIEAGGRTKLQAVDLNRFFPVGGFGEDGEDRAQIARAAVRRSEEFYRTTFAPSRIFVVGDAEADIQAAKSANLKSIAVTTGWTDKADLSRLEPDLVLDDLRQSAAFLSAIGIEDPTGHRLSAIDPA